MTSDTHVVAHKTSDNQATKHKKTNTMNKLLVFALLIAAALAFDFENDSMFEDAQVLAAPAAKPKDYSKDPNFTRLLTPYCYAAKKKLACPDGQISGNYKGKLYCGNSVAEMNKALGRGTAVEMGQIEYCHIQPKYFALQKMGYNNMCCGVYSSNSFVRNADAVMFKQQ